MRRLGLVLLILAPTVIFLSWLSWYLTPARPVNLLVIDKTMVTEQGNEHRALSWLLVHERYVPITGTFDPGGMTVGFRPTGKGQYELTGFEALDSTELIRRADTYDAAYLADSYGIFERTWFQAYPELGPVTNPTRKIYGGLHRNDLTVLNRLKTRKKLIIAEFSCLEPPTRPDVRADLEGLLGLRWTGWSGRSFQSLDSTGSDLPAWIVTNYMRQSGGSWPFRDAPGIVLTHLDERIVILRYPEDLERPTPEVSMTFEHRDRFDGPSFPLSYPFWFDIVLPDTTMQSVAYFTLPTSVASDSVLRAFGIPRIFPAVLEERGTRRTYYFAGDFADYPDVYHLLSHFRGVRRLRLELYTIDDPASRSEFYWTFYYPMVRSILQHSLPQR